MSIASRAGVLLLAVTVGLGACGGTGPGGGESRPPSPGTESLLTVVDGRFPEAFARNFNPFAPAPLWPTTYGVYEPLIIYNMIRTTYEPWLATGYDWSEGNTRLTFKLRPSVVWSDGEPFTARDVVFTFDLLRRHPAADAKQVWTYLQEVRPVDDHTVEFRFRRPYTPGLQPLGEQCIAPRHAFEKVDDPVGWANPDPVATGPFTVVKSFRPGGYELTVNERYWQRDRIRIGGLRVPFLKNNEEAIDALMAGDIDWGDIFIPDAESTFVARDPAHHRVWNPPHGNLVLLYVNTTLPPFDRAEVRKALSAAVDRSRLVREAVNGYASVADSTGLTNDTDLHWKDVSTKLPEDWTAYDPARAASRLDALGLARGPDGVRRLPGGAPLRYTFDVVDGWTDWVQAAGIISEELKAVGVAVRVRVLPFGTWLDNVQQGRFEMTIGWAPRGPTPYTFYRSQMGNETRRAVGSPSTENWHRFASREADRELGRFEAVAEPNEAKAIARRLQALYVDAAPSIPLFNRPAWGEFSLRRFTGFPSKANPYTRLSPYLAERLLVMRELRPAGAR